MTENENYCDKHISPKLFKLATTAKVRDIPFLAVVEYAPGKLEITKTREDIAGFGFLMACWAARCGGNIDQFILTAINYAREHGHNSVFLQQQGIPSRPVEVASNIKGNP